MAFPVMGIQLYTLRDFTQNEKDFDSTLKRLSDMGVRDVQISAIGDIEPEKQREILDRYSVKVCVTHKGFERIISDTDALIDEHRSIGCDAIGLGSLPEKFRASLYEAEKAIKTLDETGLYLRQHGMSFNYHNHDFEFRPLDDGKTTIMDLLLKSENINFIPDVAWMEIAGVNPVEMLEKMKGRVKVIHFKDYDYDENSKRSFVSLGKGKCDLPACYEAAVRLGIPYIMYEQDSGWINGDAFLATEESWEYMNVLTAK